VADGVLQVPLREVLRADVVHQEEENNQVGIIY
jgi:hypothetical protein